MSRPDKFGGYVLYRIFYGGTIAYLGRTKQPLQDRIRGHVFNKPMHRKIEIEKVSKIEYAEFQTEADMYLYEIYFINLWHPPLNRDDKATDDLTVSLPDVSWNEFTTPLWDKWKKRILDEIEDEKRRKQESLDRINLESSLRRKRRSGEISEEEYFKEMSRLGVFLF